jgi:uncharacterized phage protein (TIGR02216 family)
VLHLALGHLRWTPDALWRATPREIALALAPPDGGSARTADLRALMKIFPDER